MESWWHNPIAAAVALGLDLSQDCGPGEVDHLESVVEKPCSRELLHSLCSTFARFTQFRERGFCPKKQENHFIFQSKLNFSSNNSIKINYIYSKLEKFNNNYCDFTQLVKKSRVKAFEIFEKQSKFTKKNRSFGKFQRKLNR